MERGQTHLEPDPLQAIARLRVIVGYLGEKAQFDWWPSGFFSPLSAAFLDPIFARTAPLAQYHGVMEAARRVHDEHLGVGRVFHLYRLPETLEQSLFERLQDPVVAVAAHRDIVSQAAALAALQSFFHTPNPVQEGAIQIGTTADLECDNWIAAATSGYHTAFTRGMRSYPYLVDRS